MTERNRSCEALILHSRESPAGHRIVSALTAEEGIIDVFVFGGPKSSLRSAASALIHGRMLVYSDPSKGYRKLGDMSVLESFAGLRESYSRIWSAEVIAEFVLRTQGCGGEYAEVLSAVLEALRALEDADDDAAAAILLAFLWRMLGTMGLMPDTERCARCGRPLRGHPGGPAAYYAPDLDGFVGETCGRRPEDAEASPRFPLEPKDLAWLASAGSRPAAEAGNAARGAVPEGRPTKNLERFIFYITQKSTEGSMKSLMA